MIRYGVVAAEAPGQGVPIRLYARNSPVAKCYQELAAEIVADEPAPSVFADRDADAESKATAATKRQAKR